MINNYIAIVMFFFLVIIIIRSRINKKRELKNLSKKKLLFNNQSKWKHIFFLVFFVIMFISFSYDLFNKLLNNKQISLNFGDGIVSYFIYSMFMFTLAYKFRDPVILKDDSINNVKHEKIKGYFFKNHIFSDKKKCIIHHNLIWNIDVNFSITYLDNFEKEKLENYLLNNGIKKIC